ncbi:DNA polymerase III subunit alpha [Gammaproteobacteria bacterium]
MSIHFVHLHVHTEYSLLDGVITIKPLISTVVNAGMPAVAITDQSNLFALVRFYKAAQAAGIKPIVGVDLWIREDDPQAPATRLLLLCQNLMGYRNLTHLISRAYIEGQDRGMPMVRREWFKGKTDGLIALSGGREGDVGQALLARHHEEALNHLDRWLALFSGRYYLELIRTGREGEEDYLRMAVNIAGERGLQVVATNDARFLTREDFEVHEARVCIHDGCTLNDPRRLRRYSEEQYLKTSEEMAELFSDIPEALENSLQIARRCNLTLQLGEVFLPDFPIPSGTTMEEYFRVLAREGLSVRFQKILDPGAADYLERKRTYEARLEMELDVIIQMKFPGYFLIVTDFIRWAKEHDIPVGPGRGSGAGSLVAYALSITDLDPLPYDLLFERFLNPERISMPDFDVDFCMERRDEVIDYVADRYGRDRVSQIITYGSMNAKAVVRDVGRVLGYPYGFVDAIAKLIPFELGITLDKALEQEDILRNRYTQEDEVHTLIDLARKLEGLVRNAGKHAGGVVIASSKLTDFTPLYCEPGGTGLVTQFDKDDVEQAGLIKFDFLGLRTLTIINWTIKSINQHRQLVGESLVDISTIPLDDRKSFDLLKATNTTAVFQLESRGMKDLIKRLQPDCFEDIIALMALFRPGPLQSGMVDDFIDRKHGHATVDYPHPALEQVLKPTYGIILYQEQVMQIAQVLAGYTLGSADLLRRAMGKKKPEEMAKQRDIFVDGAKARGVASETATYIFDLMEKFAGYGFNKSHSAAYALISYQTAWLKAHYPAEFMAAVLSADMDNTDKVVTFIDECRLMKLIVIPPDVNHSEFRFKVGDNNSIIYGLGALKGVGEGAIAGILESRHAHGKFCDLFDFCRRIDARKTNRRVLEVLIRAGALDSLAPGRATLMHNLERAIQAAERHLRDASLGQVDLFSDSLTVVTSTVERCENQPDWDIRMRLAGEKDTLGLYLTGHPIDEYAAELVHIVTSPLADLRPNINTRDKPKNKSKDKLAVVAGQVLGLRVMQNKRDGGRMAFLTLDDRSTRVEVAVFNEVYMQYRDLLTKDRLVVVEGSVTMDDFFGGLRISAERLWDMDQAREFFSKALVLRVTHADHGLPRHLVEILTPFRGGRCAVHVDYSNKNASAVLILGRNWYCRPTDDLISRLRGLLGTENVSVIY